MTYEEFAEAADGLYAYDSGCVDSGVHDNALKAKVELELGGPNGSAWVTRFIRERCVSEEAETQGYGWEDAAGFLRWLADEMNFG